MSQGLKLRQRTATAIRTNYALRGLLLRGCECNRIIRGRPFWSRLSSFA